MFEHLTELLRCPVTQSKLSLFVISKRKKLFAGKEAEIIWEGVLYSDNKWFYPVIDGIPRLIVEGFIDYESFLAKHVSDYAERKKHLLREYKELLHTVINNNKHTRQSFEQEWSLYNYETDKTWDMDNDGMFQRFLTETDETTVSLKGKLIFDAGCGNGKLNILIAEAGAKNIAMDFSMSIIRAFNHNTNPNVWFIQGDVQYPPVTFNRFDIIQCSGVLIHTQKPEHTFVCIDKCVAPNGKLSVWLYHPRKNIIHRLFNFSRSITSKLPVRLQYYLYAVTLFPVSFIVKKLKGNKQNAHEMMIDILDWFSPQYRHEFTTAQAEAWYNKRGYTNIKVTHTSLFGFNMVGIKNQ